MRIERIVVKIPTVARSGGCEVVSDLAAIRAEMRVETREDARLLSAHWIESNRFDRFVFYALVDEARPAQYRRIRLVEQERVVQGLSSAVYFGFVQSRDDSELILHAFDLGPCAAPGGDPEGSEGDP